MHRGKTWRLRSSQRALIGLLGLGLAACGAPAEVWMGTAEIEFEATSTLHDFTGTASAEPFLFSIVPAGDFATLGGTAAVAVATMDTRHAKRDANLRKMFAAERYPLLVGTVAPIRVDLNAPPPSIPIQLTICERTRTVPATVSNWQREEGLYRFELTLSLSLQAFALEPPVILGFIRVGDAVVVRARVRLARSPDSARP